MNNNKMQAWKPATRQVWKPALLPAACLAFAASGPAALAQPAAGAPATAAASPNVVLILTDDEGIDAIGYLGNTQLRTPRIDAFAAQSTQLDHFYVSPICSPSRASLMTGRYNMRTGVLDTGDGRSCLLAGEVTIAEMLRARGYSTGIFGKWHLGDNAPFRPMDHGFDESIVIVGGMIGRSFNPLGGASYFDPILQHEGREERYRGFITDILTDKAIDFIDRHKDHPFFLYLAYNTPHHPLSAKDEDAEPYRKAGLSDETSRFYGLISNLDHNIGRVLDELARLSLDKNTVVIFMSDNGTSGLLKEKDRYHSGLRGHKTMIYEGGIRVPFCIRWPGHIEAGRKIDNINTAHIDIFPTLRDICAGGGANPQSPPVDGVSLWPLLSGAEKTLPDRKLFIQWQGADNPWLFRNLAVLTPSIKLAQPVGRYLSEKDTLLRFELYNLGKDPFEKHNLAANHEDVVASLKDAAAKWFAGMGLAPGPDGLAPYELPLCYVGTEWENPVRLTRMDWHVDDAKPHADAPRSDSQSDAAQGWWVFDTRAPANYEITLWFSDVLDEKGIVHLKINDTEQTRIMTAGESAVRVSSVALAAGKTRLEAWLQLPNERRAVRFVDIRRIDIPDSIKPCKAP